MALPNTEKLSLIETLYERLKVKKPVRAPEAYRPLTWEQIKEMAGQGLEVGSHSYSHPILTQLYADELHLELTSSREAIQKQLSFSTPAFCYPNGQQIDFTDEIKQAVKTAGYSYALAAYPGPSPLGDFWAVNRYPAHQSLSLFEKSLFGFTYIGFLGKE
jgi:peptidoglycan/xylan/chitin deacetylase (PgdA/CDA1 family)